MNVEQDIAPWLIPFHPPTQAGSRLICAPFAGGAASVFRSWAHALRDSVEVLAIQLPGREQRFHQPPATRIEQFIDELTDAVLKLATKPTYLFGHSSGAMIVFELARRLAARGDRHQPQAILASACQPPHGTSPLNQRLSSYDDAALVAELKAMQRHPNPLLENAQTRQLFLPLIRADIEMGEAYRRRVTDGIEIPIYAFRGTDDPYIDVDAWRRWGELTSAEHHPLECPGGHFFPFDEPATPLAIIQSIIAP